MLGNVEIHGENGVLRPRRSAERCVLAILALNARSPVTVSALVDHLWSGSEQSDKSIDTVGSYLRRVRAAIKQAGGQAGWLRYDRTTRSWTLDIDPAWVDYHQFAAEAAIARRDDDPAAWRAALARWRGPALADVSGHWADHRRHILESERLATYEDLLRHELAAGQHAQVVRTVTDLVENSTPTDGLLLLGAQGLAGSGRHTAIRGWVTRVTQRMRATVDVVPSAEVLDEIDRLTTLPIHRTPVPTAMFSMRTDITTFTGRTDELHSLVAAALDGLDSEVRAIAIHAVDGMAGVGKTVFSVHAAHHLADRFPDGRLFVELHGHTPGRTPVAAVEALDSLLRAAGVDPTMIPPKLEDRARLWRDRTAGRKILVVLDDAADHDQVRPLLPGPAGSLVLVTSRHRLPALDGVSTLTLDVLQPAQAVNLLERLAGDRHDEHAVAEIVARCGCLPLAISLAGAQLRAHPRWTARYLADLLAGEHERLEHLAAGDRSVSAAFTMSLRHLPVAQQRLFRLLGVHPGPEIDAHAAAALAEAPVREVQRLLEALYTYHLIQETAPGRYQLHDLVRSYATTLATELDPDDRRQALHRVLTYYRAMAQTANTYLPTYHTATSPQVTIAPADMPPMADSADAQAWFTAELPTLTACVQHAAAAKDHVIHLAASLQPFLRLNDYTGQARHIHQTALAAAVHLGDRQGQANTLINLGRLQYQQSEYDAAADTHSRALRLYTELNDQLGQANALDNLGDVQRLQGRYDAAVHSHAQALKLYVELNDRLGQANALDNLGDVRRQQGEYDAAVHNHALALKLYVTLGDRRGQATALTNLGAVGYPRGEYEQAADNYTHALELYAALGDRRGQVNALMGLGGVRFLRGEYEQAAGKFTRALELCTASGDRRGQANALIGLGSVRRQRGEYDAADLDLTHALRLCDALGYRWGQATALTHLGTVRRQRGRYAAAAENFARALELYAGLGDPDGTAETLNNLGDLTLDHPAAGDPAVYFGQAGAVARDIGATKQEARALAGQARSLLRTNDTGQAVVLFGQAQALYESLGVPEAAQIRIALARLRSPLDSLHGELGVCPGDAG
ncbi:tetratricopeptide (TPR) repeat protein [Actinocrispum wychmicini]|uniref:Tetratricopeptide (TPR) repeat protein n=1 Tax=Actinocrispum wychmicini TaxID=1213861 RepID=A0A4R2JI36_9PSEU|nr:tetratricopeptide (TPR) repeat protein [Actinocrispum wychmicini]